MKIIQRASVWCELVDGHNESPSRTAMLNNDGSFTRLRRIPDVIGLRGFVLRANPLGWYRG